MNKMVLISHDKYKRLTEARQTGGSYTSSAMGSPSHDKREGGDMQLPISNANGDGGGKGGVRGGKDEERRSAVKGDARIDSIPPGIPAAQTTDEDETVTPASSVVLLSGKGDDPSNRRSSSNVTWLEVWQSV